MHKDKKYFIDQIPCGMYRITSDNSLEKLKDPILTAIKPDERLENMRYSQMIPGSEEEATSLQSKYLLSYKICINNSVKL